MKNGIYFGMSEDDYHAIPRLSSSGIGKLRISAGDFWADSWLNPNPPELTEDQEKRQQAARFIGRAYHCARLEPDRFEQEYTRELDKSDYADVEGFLSSTTEYSNALSDLGQAKKKAGEKVHEQALRLKAAGYEKPLWHLELHDWQIAIGERSPIPANVWDEIMVDMERIKLLPAITEKLTGGAAEVSVLWTDENGIDLKCRFDYLRPDLVADLKTFANPSGKHVRQCISDAIDYNRYYIQAALYWEAAEVVRTGDLDLFFSDEMDATEAVRCTELYAEVQANSDEMEFYWIFQQKGGVPNIYSRRFMRFFIPDEVKNNSAGLSDEKLREVYLKRREKTLIMTKAQGEIALAKRDFSAYSDIYSEGDPWFPVDVEGEIGDDDFRPYRLENYN